ncbi:MAG: FAD-binding oxidoreductase [Leptolyngbyaceae cyanobacterium CSU_1_3]|nr:FAD-binding oxidoreductase [Leptolyngbyaceae cyanobacterium CSU_1_3]
MTLTEQILAQLPGDALGGLRRTDELWRSLRANTLPVSTVVQESDEWLETVDWDVVICGGTLGILLGAALAQKGWRVALLERGILRGRAQEWNISRNELQVFVELGLLTEEELQKGAIATEFNPVRVSFLGGSEVFARDVLNIGVDPIFLLETLKQKFLQSGGQLFENTPFVGVTVHPNGVQIAGEKTLTARLMLDAMGHFSAVVRQARQGKKPDAVCLVVGSCAKGFPENNSGDLIASFTPLQNQCQYFWEAFPARDGRTTYLFTYLDAEVDRFSLETFFDEYLRLLPDYQKVDLSQLQFQRALFGFFPCYRDSPLQPSWDRILPIGDSSGSQSPLSFGGFGAMVRHLRRLTEGIHEALENDILHRNGLALLQPYQPNLTVTWLFQRAMSVGIDQKIEPNQINELLAIVFQEMQQLGDPILRPFLQDVIQFSPLFQTLLKTGFSHPQTVLKIIPQVGVLTLIDWIKHYTNLMIYSALYPLGKAITPWVNRLPSIQQYYWHCRIQAWKYGSGADYQK